VRQIPALVLMHGKHSMAEHLSKGLHAICTLPLKTIYHQLKPAISRTTVFLNNKRQLVQ